MTEVVVSQVNQEIECKINKDRFACCAGIVQKNYKN